MIHQPNWRDFVWQKFVNSNTTGIWVTLASDEYDEMSAGTSVYIHPCVRRWSGLWAPSTRKSVRTPRTSDADRSRRGCVVSVRRTAWWRPSPCERASRRWRPMPRPTAGSGWRQRTAVGTGDDRRRPPSVAGRAAYWATGTKRRSSVERNLSSSERAPGGCCGCPCVRLSRFVRQVIIDGGRNLSRPPARHRQHCRRCYWFCCWWCCRCGQQQTTWSERANERTLKTSLSPRQPHKTQHCFPRRCHVTNRRRDDFTLYSRRCSYTKLIKKKQLL